MSSANRNAVKQPRFSRFLVLSLSMTLLAGSNNCSYATGDISTAAKAATQKQAAPDSGKEHPRLSSFIKPETYELTFEPDLVNFTFVGKETIKLNVSKATSVITLNSLDLEVSDVVIESLDGGSKTVLEAKVECDPKKEQVHFLLPQQLPPGSYKLHAQFKGILNDQLRGFYRSYFKDEKGEKHWLCSSQMEPADARRMFPCFDEPEFKATFQLKAVIDQNLTAISNAPVASVSEDTEKKKKTIIFEASPKMSTYLMVLVVGDFKCTEERKAGGVPIRVWAPSGQEKMGYYSLGAACESLVFLSDYFGIKYPAKKLDLIAIPDFAPGAMENLGAITFKDSLLLIDEKTGSNFAKRSALSVIAHEIAHQWFGDLVTMKWWDDLWLNEAFATWAATKTEDALRPSWRIRTKAVLDSVSAMSIDELASTRAIHAHVSNPKQASEMFDAITYEKGSAVLRMLEVFVGEKNFQKGVHDYLETNKWGNATSDDLWKSIGAASKNVPVPEMMQTWIMQAGFPLVTAKGPDKNNNLSISQEKFLVMPGEASHKDSKWIIPVLARDTSMPATGKSEGASKAASATESQKSKALLLDKTEAAFSVPGTWKSPFLNAGASGFYRVLYSQGALKQLLADFKFLTPDERLSLMSDMKTLAWKGSLPVESSLDLMLKVKDENDPIVLNSLAGRFASARSYMDDATKPAYEKLICAYLLPLKRKIGWQEQKGEEETVKDLRADVLRLLGTYGQEKQTINEAGERYDSYMKDRESVSADIIGSVLAIVAYNGTDREYEEMKTAWKKAGNPQEEKRFLSALGQFRQTELIAKTLNLALSQETRATDCVALLGALLSNKDSNRQAWEFTKQNWTELTKKFPPRFNKRIVATCDSLDTPELEKDLNEFFAGRNIEMAKAAIARTLESVHVGVLYRQRNENRIRQWVTKQVSSL